MTTENQLPTISPQLMAIRLHGAASIASEADAVQLSARARMPLNSFLKTDDTLEAWLGNVHISVADRATTLSYWFTAANAADGYGAQIDRCAEITALMPADDHVNTIIMVGATIGAITNIGARYPTLPDIASRPLVRGDFPTPIPRWRRPESAENPANPVTQPTL